ncbi:MAG: hypothetical protein KKB50_05910 [Planctomycetes bacterium]|nr:hypothetical protein [Planctomycetota bacterium]
MNLRCFIVLGVFALGGLAPCGGMAQTPPPSAAEADEVALTVEFQKVIEEYVSLPRAPIRASEEQLAQWRSELEPRLDSLITRLQSLARQAGRPPDVLLIQALCHARRANLWLAQRRELDARYDATQERELAVQRSRLAERVAEEYQTINVVLQEALREAEALRQSREISLVQGVILAQTAIVQDRAMAAAEEAKLPVQTDARVIPQLLSDADELLRTYLAATGPERGLEWVRGQFYAGVVKYRRALRPRVAGQKYFTELDVDNPASREAFARAREIFKRLSDPDEVLRILAPADDPEQVADRAFKSSGFYLEVAYSPEMVARYYAASANLYLGLISAIDPQYEASPEARLTASREPLERARALDTYQPPVDEAFSLTDGTIPVSYTKVLAELEAATRETGEPEPLNDLTLTFGLTPIYDTNVSLLGRNTDTPIDRQRKRDFRTASILKLSYVADLDACDKGNELLSKWQVLFEARVAPTWNVRMRDYNEQLYGGTANLRYELLGPNKLPAVDGVYLHARYDYDYVLLGNDGFLRLHRVRPSMQVVAFDQVLNGSLFFQYEDRNYLEELRDERFDRDGNYFSWGADARLDLGRWVNAEQLWGPENVWGPWAPNENDWDYKRPLRVFGGLEFATNSTQGHDFDYESQIISTGAQLPLPYGIDLSGRAFFEWQDYRGNSLVDRKRRSRHDFIQEYAFRTERRFYVTEYGDDFEHTHPLNLRRVVLTLFGELRFTLDDSNVRDRLGQSIFEYNRIMYSAGVRFDIN